MRLKQQQLSSRRRIERIVDLLSGEYGSPDLGNKADPIDEIVFIILSAKTDEQKYLRAYDNLRSQIGSWEEVLVATLETVQGAIGYAGMGKAACQDDQGSACCCEETFWLSRPFGTR